MFNLNSSSMADLILCDLWRLSVSSECFLKGNHVAPVEIFLPQELPITWSLPLFSMLIAEPYVKAAAGNFTWNHNFHIVGFRIRKGFVTLFMKKKMLMWLQECLLPEMLSWGLNLQLQSSICHFVGDKSASTLTESLLLVLTDHFYPISVFLRWHTQICRSTSESCGPNYVECVCLLAGMLKLIRILSMSVNVNYKTYSEPQSNRSKWLHSQGMTKDFIMYALDGFHSSQLGSVPFRSKDSDAALVPLPHQTELNSNACY